MTFTNEVFVNIFPLRNVYLKQKQLEEEEEEEEEEEQAADLAFKRAIEASLALEKYFKDSRLEIQSFLLANNFCPSCSPSKGQCGIITTRATFLKTSLA